MFCAHPRSAARFTSVPATVASLLLSHDPGSVSLGQRTVLILCQPFTKCGALGEAALLGNMLKIIKILKSHPTPTGRETTVEQAFQVFLMLLTFESHWIADTHLLCGQGEPPYLGFQGPSCSHDKPFFL